VRKTTSNKNCRIIAEASETGGQRKAHTRPDQRDSLGDLTGFATIRRSMIRDIKRRHDRR